MNIPFNDLRKIKHRLPTGSVGLIAKQLDMTEQTVRNFFGAKKYENGEIVGKHIRPGPNGGFVMINDTRIIDLAKSIIKESKRLEAV